MTLCREIDTTLGVGGSSGDASLRAWTDGSDAGPSRSDRLPAMEMDGRPSVLTGALGRWGCRPGAGERSGVPSGSVGAIESAGRSGVLGRSGLSSPTLLLSHAPTLQLSPTLPLPHAHHASTRGRRRRRRRRTAARRRGRFARRRGGPVRRAGRRSIARAPSSARPRRRGCA